MTRLNSATLATLQAFATWSVLSMPAIPMTAMAADKAPPTQLAAAAKIATVAVQGTAGSATESSLDAVVEAVRQTTVSAQVPGAIVSILVQAGDRVRAGQALVRIDARAAQQNVAGSAAQVDAAQAVLNVASKELERQKQLLAKQYISQAALERTQAQWLAAQAQVKALQAQTRVAEAQSGFFVLNAPYAGIVSEVTATVGDMAMPGRPLLVLHDPSALRVVASVPQSMLAGLSDKLKTVRYEIPGVIGQTGPRTPTQTQLLPTIDAATHTAQIRLILPAGNTAETTGLTGLAPGMFARVWLPATGSTAQPDAERLYLPSTAILRRAEMTGVYVLDAQGQPRLRQVRLGRAAGELVEVLSGVRKGEQVAADPKTVNTL
jgi:multidrug efflux system membrane fusion protein